MKIFSVLYISNLKALYCEREAKCLSLREIPRSDNAIKYFSGNNAKEYLKYKLLKYFEAPRSNAVLVVLRSNYYFLSTSIK